MVERNIAFLKMSVKRIAGLLLISALSVAFMVKGTDAKVKAEAVVEAGANNPYEVGVFYFSNWNPELNPAAAANGVWSGVQSVLTGPGPWGLGSVPYREPEAG